MRRNTQTYGIGEVSKATNVTQKQIRNWEAKGYIPKADRIACGDRAYRRFSLKQVEVISRIKGYLDEGYALSAAAEKAKADNLQQRKEFRPGGIY